MTASRIGELVFRVGFGLFFALAGLGHLVNFPMTVDGAGILFRDETMAQAAAVLAVVFLLAGGLSVAFGFKARVGGVLLALFLIPATLIHVLVMEMAVNSASLLQADAAAGAAQTIETLRNMAVQGHQANVMKNLVLLLGALRFALVRR